MGKTGIGPVRLEPVYKKAIWAGTRLKKIRNLKEDGIGICREVCAYPGSENRIAAGTFTGQPVSCLIKEHHQSLMGKDVSTQLVRVAYMDTQEDLSIQVHPNEEQAAGAGDYEKSESWYIVEADEGAYITAGVNVLDKNVLRKAAENGEMEQYLVKHFVQAGDFAMIPAGMIHACGKNMLVLEIGSFGGITYRLYDYGRGRELNLDLGMRVAEPSLQCQLVHVQERKPGIPRALVRHSLFGVDVLDVEGSFFFDECDRYRIITCVKGSCNVIWNGERYWMKYTETLLIPASCRPVEIEGDARILISWKG